MWFLFLDLSDCDSDILLKRGNLFSTPMGPRSPSVRSSSRARARSRRTTRLPTASPPSPATSIRVPRAGRPTAPWTGTPGSSSLPLPASPRSSRTSTPSSARPGSRSTWRITMVASVPLPIEDLAHAVASVVLTKQEEWSYACRSSRSPPPRWPSAWTGPAYILCEDGWRETMVGTLAFYDRGGGVTAHGLPRR